MTSTSIAEAKAQLSALVGHVAHSGETVTLTKRGKPVARIVPWTPDRPGLQDFEGWLDDEDPILASIEAEVGRRRPPRQLGA